MSTAWLIQGGRLLDPATGRDGHGDLVLLDGHIAPPGTPPPPGSSRLDARGFVIVPGFLDVHVHLREPGGEEQETIATGSLAAARGGFTTILAMPNTRPPVDTPQQILRLYGRPAPDAPVRILACGCLTRRRAGRDLADLAGMAAAGAIAFTDDGNTVPDQALMARAMHACRALSCPVLDHAIDPVLAADGVIHKGSVSARLGLPGIPAEAETTIVERDIRLVRETGCALHIQHVSTRTSVELIRSARAEGLPVSGEATPHHLALTEDDVHPDDANGKMNPPLRTAADRLALQQAVLDGTLEILATDHAPHTARAKAAGLAAAPFGVIGLETAIGVTYTTLVRSAGMPLLDWVRRWTLGPARLLGLPAPSLEPGAPADLTLLDLDTRWTVVPDEFLSRSRNTPFAGRRLHGRAVGTFRRGLPTRLLPLPGDLPGRHT